jgi:hypothetical protein
MTPENGVELMLGPGDIFQLSTRWKSVQFPSRYLVSAAGDLDASHIWGKIADKDHGMFSRMPMHTPGLADCDALKAIGKWIRSFESPQAAIDFKPECKKTNDFGMIDLDLTWPKFDKYTPRRDDWKDSIEGMPQKYRQIELTPSLKQAIQTEYAVGYWLKKPECKFPEVDLPPEKRRPWMMSGNKPKRPFGEIYSTTPGSYFYRDTCMKCHGQLADGNGSLARGILMWSGGKVRVADFMSDSNGMFGGKTANLSTFDLDGKNYAGQYLIWMAMEGTRVKFPPELGNFLGRHGGQMLNGIRDKCLMQIATKKHSSPRFPEHEIFNQVCFMENLNPGHPDLVFDPNTDLPVYPERVEAWLDRAAWNAGWAIFEFLREAGNGLWRPAIDQCEVQYPIRRPQ